MMASVEYIMLCGGIGSRLNQSLFPKPMTLIAGRQLFLRVIESLPMASITFILNPHLKAYNFASLVAKALLLKHTKPSFWYLPFETRGAVESLYLYLREKSYERQIVVLDNDNLYNFGYLSPYGCGVFFCEDDSIDQKSESYSFIQVDDNGGVTAISEKEKISDKICVGYYMNGIDKKLEELSLLIKQSNFYLSSLYKMMIDNSITVTSTKIKAFTLGTVNDVLYSDNELQRRDMIDKPAVVFDIDNTLIDTSGKPIKEQLEFANFLKKRGWRIILYTARGMKWSPIVSESTKEKVKADVAGLIDYDEIHFGKPYGEIYIDDKAFNPYDDKFYEKLGFFNLKHQYPSVQSSKNNVIIRSSNNTIIKQSSSVINEVSYYKFISKTYFSRFFPTLIDYNLTSIELEYIPGPTFSNLFIEDLLNEDIFIKLLDLMDSLHESAVSDDIIITQEDIKSFYMSKFYERRETIGIDASYADKIEKIALTHSDNSYQLVNITHGDLWFRNVIIYKNEIKLIDMRGKIGDKMTVRGDKFYDYAKIYQSLIGMDHALAGREYHGSRLTKIFEERYKKDIKLIKSLSMYTIFCSLPSWGEREQSTLVKLLINELTKLDREI